jgi:hypothetical protein
VNQYQLHCPPALLDKMYEANKSFTAVGTAIGQLLQNPFAVAIETHVPRFGKYYIDCGVYCISFDVTESHVCIKYFCKTPEFLKILNAPG